MSGSNRSSHQPGTTARRDFLGHAAGLTATAALTTGSNTAAGAEAMEAKTRHAKSFRDHLLDCLGGAWPEDCPLDPSPRAAVERDGYRIESIDYQVEPRDRVPALLLVPDGVDAAHPAPAVAVWHQHNGEWHFEKSEPAGLAGNPMHHTGVALAKEGEAVRGSPARSLLQPGSQKTGDK